jgi:hypothetical protein
MSTAATGHTWVARSVVALAASPAEPPTIGGLLYPAKRAVFSGETESLKTWLALILAKAEMDIGHPVAWVDLDAMGSAEILARLRALGVADSVVHDLFLYYEPGERLAGEMLAEVCEAIGARRIRLFVVDAFNPLLSLHGLDPNSTADVEAFWREVATPITDAGAAPLMLDHVVKNREAQGKYAYGSERKASGAIVHVGFRLLEPLTRGGSGAAHLMTHKDRPGFLPRPTIGRLVLDSNAGAISYRLEEDRSRADGRFRPTVLMERISRRLELLDDPVSQTWVEENVSGNAPALREALAVLTDEGYMERADGPRNSFLFSAIRPFREADDAVESDVGATPSSPRPHPVPDLRSTRTVTTPSPSPLIGDGVAPGLTGTLTTSPDPVPRGRRRPLLGDDGCVHRLLLAANAGHITEAERRRAARAHRLVVDRGLPTAAIDGTRAS